MQTVRALVETPIADSPRVQLVGGMFDLGIPASTRAEFQADLPGLEEDWRIGCVVGPSGSGKSTIAREAFGDGLWREPAWPADAAIIDAFGDVDVRTATSMLTAVGFSSPPAWIRPFRTLSNGEQFRANLARALLAGKPLVAYDEFTSVVDRTVAQVGSAAVAKSIRKGLIASRFVAVSCHYDILPWLAPDWVLDTSDWTVSRRSLRRPDIRLEVSRCLPGAWSMFKRHHYLSASLHRSARCYLATFDGRPIAFAALLPSPGHKGRWRVSRVVVLPDWQGIGVGRAFLGSLGDLYRRADITLSLLTSHTMMIRCLAHDSRWRVGSVNRNGSPAAGGTETHHHPSRRPGVSFRYVGRQEEA